MIRTAITENGTVKGLPADDPRVTVFKGIPFAAPPTGENRWRAPQPAADWEGVRNCYEFGPVSMQDQPGLNGDIYCREFHVDPDIPLSEDSLYLNIWTGAKDASEKLPVLIWIYGGAFQWGYTAEMEFNGERLARHGIIVVSVAYRLGAFGFLAHEELTKEDAEHPTNFGLLDQKAAISWVYRNIAAFGGDPEMITLGGQSAGGGSVLYCLQDAETAPMIKRATVISGIIRNPFSFDTITNPMGLSDMEANGRDFIEYLGCSSVKEARQLDAVKIRDAYKEYALSHPRFVPCVDGVFMKEDAYRLMLRGSFPDVPMFTGYTENEFITVLPTSADKTTGSFKADIITKSGVSYFNIVQNSVRCVAAAHMEHAMKAPMYVYRFAPDIPGYDDPGAFHSCDLWFFFETIQKCWRPYNGAHYALARRMCDYWTNYIKTGDPNGEGYDGERLPVWKPVSSGDPANDEIVFACR